MQRRAATQAAHRATSTLRATAHPAAAASSLVGRQWKGRVGSLAQPHAQRSFTVQRAQASTRAASSLSSQSRRFLSSSSSAASSSGGGASGENDGAANSSNSSSSGSNSNDDTPSRRRALVAVTDKEVFARTFITATRACAVERSRASHARDGPMLIRTRCDCCVLVFQLRARASFLWVRCPSLLSFCFCRSFDP